jgi:choline-sulfatase
VERAQTGTPPNLLVIMSDEHAPHFSGAYGHPLVQTPHLDRLSAEGVLFENAYCNSPLCGPSRMSFMTGRHVHEIGAWDNSTPLASDVPTWAHMLRTAGYDVVLSGKQHFVGADQLHGFRAQLARDLHAEHAHPTFAWDDGTREATQPWPSLKQAGPGTTTEIEVDDQVEETALAYLREPERHDGPWALNVSFIAPHFPFVVPERYWSMYEQADIDLPSIPPGHLESQHPVYQRMRRMFGMIAFDEDLVRRGRIGYYGLITYLDDKIGRLLATLEEQGLAEDTLVVYVSDHGEMAGEHGMWRKSNFYEHSARIPLVLRWPGRLPEGKRVPEVVSLVDLVATLVDAAGATSPGPLSGTSLLPLARGELAAGAWKDEALSMYLAHGVAGPMAMLRSGRYKLNESLGDEPELYDVAADPEELTDLAADPAHREVLAELRARLAVMWDPVDLDRRVRQSQRDRLFIEAAMGRSAEEARAQWYASGSTVTTRA